MHLAVELANLMFTHKSVSNPVYKSTLVFVLKSGIF